MTRELQGLLLVVAAFVLAACGDGANEPCVGSQCGGDVALPGTDALQADAPVNVDGSSLDIPLYTDLPADFASADVLVLPDTPLPQDGIPQDSPVADDILFNETAFPEDLLAPEDALPDQEEHVYYDLVVVGAGTGGVSAAIEAARLGMKVALVERTDWLGGQMTAAAVTSMDEGHKNRDSGIYKEFIDKIKAHYGALGKSIGTCYWSNGTYCFEPSVGRGILEEMVAAEGSAIDLYTRATITDVLSNGALVQGVKADVRVGNLVQPYVFHAVQTIDATEAGDVLAFGPAPYRLGRGTSYAPEPTSCIQEFTYTAVIRKYPGGLPAGFAINSPPPGYDEAVEDHFQSIVAPGGAHWVSEAHVYPVDWATHTGYRGMPDSTAPGSAQSSQPEQLSRTGVNWANDYPIDAGDLENGNWQTVFCAGKLRTLQFLYYAQKVLGQSQWSIANDEGFGSLFQLNDNLCSNIPGNLKTLEQNLPVHPYVREGRRLIGVKLLTAKEIYREAPCPGCAPRALTTFPSSLAIADYAVDLHGCNSNADLELQFESEADVPPGFQGGAFQVPFEVFVPAAVDGLLAAEKNISVTRLVNGAIRLQPSTMLTGQAAGAIAALAIDRGIQPRKLHPAVVQDHLVNQGCMLAVWPFADVPRAHPAWADVQFVSARELMSGYGETQFAPDDIMSRAMMAVFMTRLFDIPVVPGPNNPTFGDMPTSHWAYDYIEALYAAGLTNGCNLQEMLYCPDDPVVRAAAATFLMHGLGYDPDSAPANPYYTDIDASHWGFPWVQWATKEGIMSGCGGGKFCPGDPLTRAAVASAGRKVVLLTAE